MKKIVLTLLILMISVLYIVPSTYAYVPPVSDSYLLGQGLGRTVDIAKSRYAHPDSIILGSNVISPSYLSSLSLDRIEYPGDYGYDLQAGNSLNTYYNQKQTKYQQSASLSGTYKLFTGSIDTTFQSSLASSEYERMGQYYSTTSMETKTVKAALPNYLDNIKQYKQELTSAFISNCYKLDNGTMTYEQFFQIYGTHLVASATFGGKVNLSYSVTDSTKYISASKGTEIQNKINAGIIGLEKYTLGFQSNVSLSQIQAITSSNATLHFRADSIGGSGFGVKTDQGDYTGELRSWVSTVYDNPAIIEYSTNGLVPLSELVPDVYTNAKQKLASNLENYIKSVNGDLSYSPSISVDRSVVRSSEETINDNGRFTNPYDLVYVSSSGYTFNNLQSRGITRVHVIIELDAKEVDDGYQYIFLYDGTSESSTLLGSYQFEHGVGYKRTNYNLSNAPYTFVFSMQLSDLSSSYAIRYGASGNGADTWKNKNVYVSYMFY